MYLKEVILIGILGLLLLLMNVVFKYYAIYKKGYRISNLIIIKLLIRVLIVFSLIGILSYELDSTRSSLVDGKKNLIFIVQSLDVKGNIILDDVIKNEIQENLNLKSNLKFGMVYLNSRGDDPKILIPLTTKDAFLNIIKSTDFFIDKVSKSVTYKMNVQENEYLKINFNNTSVNENISNIDEEDDLNFIYLANYISLTSLKFYLLILVIVLLSIDLISKVKILKL